MRSLRYLALHHRPWTAALFAFALLLKLVVPAGFMPVPIGKTLIVSLCTGAGPATFALHLPTQSDGPGEHRKVGDGLCAYGELAAPALATAGPPVTEAPLYLAQLPALQGASSHFLRGNGRVRPPSRGPPARA